MSEGKFDVGMIGLGTMGRALLLNMADHGFAVAGYDTDKAKADSLSAARDDGKVQGFTDVKAFVAGIRKPRAIMMLVPAGAPVDSVIGTLRPLLENGDFLIDGGNSYYKDTDRREKDLRGAGFGFMGMGVSGGEEGARHGPSMMPGGTPENYKRVGPILEAVAAKYEGAPCVALVGAGSAGHYVKTVHNGIEYAVMQLIAESYDLMSRGLGMSAAEIGDQFAKLNEGILGSFLIEIAAVVLRRMDDADPKRHLVDVISDKAKQKGTGKWTSQDAMDLGIPVPTIDAAVGARELSGMKELRVEADKLYKSAAPNLDKSRVLGLLEKALHACTMIAYAQGFSQLHAADKEYGFGTDLQTVAKIWRNGCIIRSKSLEPIRAAFERKPDLENLLLDQEIAKSVLEEEPALRELVCSMVRERIPCPSFGASVSYLDGFSSARLPANLIQGQRDLFGAHTYERVDKPGTFHTKWEA
ncbi:MAG TPA: NADP-dependent phosphogluconate dehydrogenase [Fimbriimonas sp.]|nr:NADP-dependent phosphogluconate dehydrogenase [Fimbriimonas sp.]